MPGNAGEGGPRGGRVFLFLAFLCFLSGCTRGPGRYVILYCSVDQTTAEPVISAFEKKTGMQVLARFDTEATKTVGLVQLLRSQAGEPRADVFWSSEVFHTIKLAREGILAPFKPEDDHSRPRRYTDPEGRWFGFAGRARVVAFNRKRVPSAEAPESIEELLSARWKGRIAMADPAFGTTSGHVAALFAYYGRKKAVEILKGLVTNRVRLVDGNSTAVRLVANGVVDICLTDTDDVYAAQRNGWPVGMKLLRHRSGGPLLIPNTASLVASCPHPEAARLLMNFLLSPEVERILARSDSHNTPLLPETAREFPEYAIENPLSVDYGTVSDRLEEAVNTAMEIFK